MNGELKVIWKEQSRYYPDICQDGLRITTQNISQESQYSYVIRSIYIWNSSTIRNVDMGIYFKNAAKM
jgi:hypothetical protein